MTAKNKVLVDAAFIKQNSKDVKINTQRIKAFVDEVVDKSRKNELEPFNFLNWRKQHLHPDFGQNEDSLLNWIFFVSCVNFSFWDERLHPYKVSYENIEYTGYWSLLGCFNKALKTGLDVTNPRFWIEAKESDLEQMFLSEGILPTMYQERIRILKESSIILNKEYEDKTSNLIIAANKDCLKLVAIIREKFTSFRDENLYKNRIVEFNKRAQIFIAEVWSAFGGKGIGEFNNINEITMFADYRVPQSLYYFGILEYSSDLLSKIKQNKLSNGCVQEIEIRGNSIYAVNQITVEFNRNRIAEDSDDARLSSNNWPRNWNSITVDFYLWEYAKHYKDKFNSENAPWHRLRCIYY